MPQRKKEKKSKKKVPACTVGKDSFSRYFGKGKNGNSEAGGSSSSWNGSGLSVLNKELKTRSILDAAAQTGEDEFNGICSIIDTEAKQLQAIEDLYLILKAQPKYKNLNDGYWTADTSPMIVLKWLLRKVATLAKGKDWFIDTFQDGKKTRYQFVVTANYSSYHFKYREAFFPLDFLPFLKLKDPAIHNMIVDIISLVSKNNKVPLWDNDGDYSSALDYWMTNESIVSNFLADKQISMYRHGIANEYLGLIKARSKMVTASDITKAMSNYEFKSDRLHGISWWLQLGLRCADYKQSIEKNSYVPNYITGTPVTPMRKHKFIWSIHQNDILDQKAESILERDYKKFGHGFWPRYFSVTKPGKKMPEMDYDDYPIDIWQFMCVARAHFLFRYKSYYYKEMLDDPVNVPGETLLEQFLYEEIKQLAK